MRHIYYCGAKVFKATTTMALNVGSLHHFVVILLWTALAAQGRVSTAFQTRPLQTLRCRSSFFSRRHPDSNRLVAFSQVESSTKHAKAVPLSSPSSTDSLTLFSPCKINLFLRILRRREDGYHDLASLFQAVGFGDTLELQRLAHDDDDNSNNTNDDRNDVNNKKISFSCNMEGVPVDSTNLVVRAIQLMKDKTGHSAVSFQANLIKQVPAQAGLGGGSANAATAMWGVNELLGRPATVEQVCHFMSGRA
jgi:hypothetical protein